MADYINKIRTTEGDKPVNYEALANKPNSLPNPNKIKFTGSVVAEYDGSSEVTVDIPNGGSEEQAAQIQTNTNDISELKNKTSELKGEIDGIIIPEKLPNPQKLTFAGAVTTEYDGSGAVTVTIPEGSGGSGGMERIEKLSTDTAVELEPNKLYIFPEMAELAITLAEPSDTGIANEYHFVFQSGATATTLSIPDTVKIPSGFSVDANKIYEISILEGCLCCQSWAVTA